ncbi:Transcription factor IIIB 70 kDa subunit [Nakaseomyces bracarensis]|uniref:B-related factor 1 n=1 Tax=Nakaseomyces bracarensis TaxID=273131 RepID=A0ABR4NR04_9SACH
MSSKLKCKGCGSTDLVVDTSNANNDLVCQNCGIVCEDNPIVSEVTFAETSSGAATVTGSFVSADQSHAAYGGSNAMESREATLNNARKKLRAVGHALAIPDYIVDASHQWYKLALAYNFVQGRRSQNVIAACLYIACRKEKTHHMLIDFSSRLQVSVYSIGATFLKMVKRLQITNLPLADPSLFIQHFAEKLELGDKKIKVVRDAVKLAQRMSNDWMFEGRRPAGIAGACILLACRMNNLRRTHSEIVAVSHVAEETLQQRLNEFKNTKAATMSVKEFRSKDHNSEGDDSAKPPSFTKNRKQEALLKKKLEKQEYLETSEEALVRNPILTQVLGEQELSSKEVLYYLKEFTQKREKVIQRMKTTHGIDDSDVLKANETEVESSDSQDNENNRKRRRSSVADESNNDNDENIENEAASLNVSLTAGRNVQDLIDGYSLENDPYRPRNLKLLPTTATLLAKVSDDPENLEDVEDEDLDAIILDEEASKLKERIWIGINSDYLLEQESKRLKQEADIAAGNTSGKRKRQKKKKPKADGEVMTAVNTMADLHDKSGIVAALREAERLGDSSAAESVKKMLQKSTFSKKINYDAVEGLFNHAGNEKEE